MVLHPVWPVKVSFLALKRMEGNSPAAVSDGSTGNKNHSKSITHPNIKMVRIAFPVLISNLLP